MVRDSVDLDPAQLAGWSVDRLAAQIIVVRTTGFLFDHQVQYPVWEADGDHLRRLVELGVGGVIFLGGSGAELALKTAGLQELALSEGLPRLLLCADIEEGVGQRFGGGTWFAPLMALGEIARTDLGCGGVGGSNGAGDGGGSEGGGAELDFGSCGGCE